MGWIDLKCFRAVFLRNAVWTSVSEGCDENGPAAALLVGHVSVQICSLLPPVRLGPPCRRPILIATKHLLFRGQDTSVIIDEQLDRRRSR
jgi:hypothetical protein